MIGGVPATHSIRQAPLAGEPQIVARLVQAAAEAGVQADPVSIVNVYVALKSTPMVILTGPAQTGKIALVHSLRRVLAGNDPYRCQIMSGHAWWAEQCRDVAFFTEMQTRLNDDKVLVLIEEAWQPENTNRVFIACLTRISPAELTGLFSALAFQLQHGQIMRLPSVHLIKPIPYPSNLFLIGTMDSNRFDWSDADLLSQTTVIHWPTAGAVPTTDGRPATANFQAESEFLSSCVRRDSAARLKLYRILESQSRVSQLLLELESCLKRHGVGLPAAARGQTIVYLANAWSKDGVGLFQRTKADNLAIALDLAIAQTILPRVAVKVQRSAALHSELAGMMNGRFPRAAAFLQSLDEVLEPDRRAAPTWCRR